METKELLNERGKTHGEFRDNSRVSQKMKDVFKEAFYEDKMESYQLEALDMIAHKIGRILCGDPNFVDHWADIAGYAQLVVKELEREDDDAVSFDDFIEVVSKKKTKKK